MSDGLIERLRKSDGYKVFKAGDGYPAFAADTDLMREAADRIDELESALRETREATTPPEGPTLTVDLESGREMSSAEYRRALESRGGRP